jgi:tetratricopeptide (TPR) repeat protein
MDRKNLAACAGFLASIGAIVGCGSGASPRQDSPPPVTARAHSEPELGQSSSISELAETGCGVQASDVADSSGPAAPESPLADLKQADANQEGALADSGHVADALPAQSAADVPAPGLPGVATPGQVVEVVTSPPAASARADEEPYPASASPVAFGTTPLSASRYEGSEESRHARVEAGAPTPSSVELRFAVPDSVLAPNMSAAIDAVTQSKPEAAAAPKSKTQAAVRRQEPVAIHKASERITHGHVASHEANVAESPKAAAPDTSNPPTFRLQIAGPELPDSVTFRVAAPEEKKEKVAESKPIAVPSKESTTTKSPVATRRVAKPAAVEPLEAAPPKIASSRLVKPVETKSAPTPAESTVAKQEKAGPTPAEDKRREPAPATVPNAPAAQTAKTESPKPEAAPIAAQPTPAEQPAPKAEVIAASPMPKETAASKQPVVAAVAPGTPPSDAPEPHVAKQTPSEPPVAVAPPTEPPLAVSPAVAPMAPQHETAPYVAAAPRPTQRPIMVPTDRDREVSQRDAHAAHSSRFMAEVSQADTQVAHGFQLAERGAIYLARADFVSAIKLIAQANDVETGTRQFSRAVTAGLVALKESGDFVRQSPTVEDVDLAKIVSGHKTSVLKNVDVSEMAPTVAAQLYYDFARDQLAAASGQELVASMALYGLAKATVVGNDNKLHQPEYTGQAMALYQTAMMVEPKNFRAANELGVLLANHGQLKLAEEMLTRSASLAPCAATWQNLAMVHSRMGDKQLAEQMQKQAREMQRSGPAAAGPAVQWVDPSTFASVAPATDAPLPPPVATKTESTSAKKTAVPANPPSSVARRINDWFPLNLRR